MVLRAQPGPYTLSGMPSPGLELGKLRACASNCNAWTPMVALPVAFTVSVVDPFCGLDGFFRVNEKT